jgi:hypothetical protein
MDSITLALTVYGGGAIIAFFVVLLIKGIFFALKLFKKNEKN